MYIMRTGDSCECCRFHLFMRLARPAYTPPGYGTPGPGAAPPKTPGPGAAPPKNYAPAPKIAPGPAAK